MNALASPAAAHLNRLESLLARAIALGCTGAIVEIDGESILSLTVWTSGRVVGFMHLNPPDELGNESWALSARCEVMAGLAMQADWLPEGAKRVREVFNALVSQ